MLRIRVAAFCLWHDLPRNCRRRKSEIRCPQDENRAMQRCPSTRDLTKPTMPNQDTDGEAALRKPGQRVRQGWAKNHPTAEQTIDPVKDTLREQWEQQRKAAPIHTPKPSPTKERHPQ